MTNHRNAADEIGRTAGHPPITVAPAFEDRHRKGAGYETQKHAWIIENAFPAALVIAGMGAGLIGLALASDGYHPGAGKLIFAGLCSMVFAAIWIWRSRRTIGAVVGNAALDTAAIGLRTGRAFASKADKIASEIKARADQRH